jgi:hypothetical protein
MTRRTWLGAVALFGSPPALVVVLIVMGSLWAAATQIAWAASALPYGGDAAALMLACFNAPFSAWLFANFLHLQRDLRDLRLPRQRWLTARSLGFFLTLIVVVPCGLVLSWRAGPLVVVLVALSAVVGMVGALLWTRLASGQHCEHSASAAGRSLALRVALGAPYAPASWQTRLLQLASVCVVLFGAPLLVIAFGRSLSSRTFAVLMHAAEFLGFIGAITLCWIGPLSRAVTLFNPARGGLTELALLPGLGTNAQRRRQLYRVVIGPPAIALTLLWWVAMAAAWLERAPDAAYIKLVVAFLVIPLFTLPIFLSQIAQAQAQTGRGRWVALSGMLTPLCGLTPMIWNLPLHAFAVVPSLLHWLGIGFAMLLLFLGGLSFLSLRNLAQRPHPFVDVS